jgi:hypothetical protein
VVNVGTFKSVLILIGFQKGVRVTDLVFNPIERARDSAGLDPANGTPGTLFEAVDRWPPAPVAKGRVSVSRAERTDSRSR